jgi:hypothetical protein
MSLINSRVRYSCEGVALPVVQLMQPGKNVCKSSLKPNFQMQPLMLPMRPNATLLKYLNMKVRGPSCRMHRMHRLHKRMHFQKIGYQPVASPNLEGCTGCIAFSVCKRGEAKLA